MAAAAEHTRGDIGPGVTCPSFRSHPAIIAQAAATMTAIYPGRFWLGLGSGEALHEHLVAGYWPEAAESINRMFESIEINRKLASGRSSRSRSFGGSSADATFGPLPDTTIAFGGGSGPCLCSPRCFTSPPP